MYLRTQPVLYKPQWKRPAHGRLGDRSCFPWQLRLRTCRPQGLSCGWDRLLSAVMIGDRLPDAWLKAAGSAPKVLHLDLDEVPAL